MVSGSRRAKSAIRACDGQIRADPLRRCAIDAAQRSRLRQRQSEDIGDDVFHQIKEEFDRAELSAQG
jgi:monovalent cation/hydrogen antiporter